MKQLSLVLFLLLSIPASADLNMNFIYEVNESGDRLSCTHERIKPWLPDWNVTCGNVEKSYSAHVIVRRYDHTSEPQPQTAFEILYWITEPGDTPTSIRKYHSVTATMYVKGETDIQKLVLYQGVENDMASLRLELSTPAIRTR